MATAPAVTGQIHREKNIINAPEAKTDPEVLTPSQRWLEIMIVAALLLLFTFLAYHQLANTGFFTARFGSLEMVCLYGPILLATAAPIVRASTGRRNPARPLEAAASLFLAIGSLWLLNVFPFSFVHLADTLPAPVRFVLAWVTDDIGRIPLILQVIIGPISALLTIWKYISIRRRESESYLKRQAS